MKINSYFLIALLLAASIVLIIFIPQWQEENYRSTINAEDIAKLDPKDRVQLQKDLALVENSFRTTLAQIIGGSLLLLSLYLTYRNVKIAQENTRIANENLRVMDEGKLTDRFSKAVELLGNEKLEIRLGGIYALERIARDSQKDHWTVMEVLTAFVRENSHKKLEEFTSQKKGEAGQNQDADEVKEKPREDIQAIMTVINRRKWVETELPRRLSLTGASLKKYYLEKANASRADFSEANLSGADLSGANLSEARLNGANLIGANLSDANLSGADLSRADFVEANLIHANLSGANLTGTNLSGADLSVAILGKANLRRAKLNRANFGGADLKKANLERTDLREADLSGANLCEAHMYSADLSGADLSNANLREADLFGVKLNGVNLAGAVLFGAQHVRFSQILDATGYEEAILPAEVEQELKEYLARR